MKTKSISALLVVLLAVLAPNQVWAAIAKGFSTSTQQHIAVDGQRTLALTLQPACPAIAPQGVLLVLNWILES